MHKHTHAIIMIKNEEEKYLQYYDNRWNSYLFINVKLTSDNGKEKITQIKKDLVGKLNVNEEDITIKLEFDRIHSKYSESAKKEKEYHHYFYKVNIEGLSNNNSSSNIIINDIEYKWFSMKELENDKRIMEINSDIVNMIKDIN